MKMLRTIRFDDTDGHVFGIAAAPDEWAISGAFAFTNVDPDELTGKERQKFRNGWLGLDSLARATFVAVADADADDFDACCARLATFLHEQFGAPDMDAAREAAEAEIQYAVEFCRDVPINTLFTVLREFDDEGAIHEEYRIVQAPSGPAHTRIWDIVEDDA